MTLRAHNPEFTTIVKTAEYKLNHEFKCNLNETNYFLRSIFISTQSTSYATGSVHLFATVKAVLVTEDKESYKRITWTNKQPTEYGIHYDEAPEWVRQLVSEHISD